MQICCHADVYDIELSDSGTVDSNLPMKNEWKISLSPVGDGSDSEPLRTDRSASEISEQSDAETIDRWSKNGRTPNIERFLTVVSVDTYDPSDINQVVTVVIGVDLIQLFAEHSNLYHRRTADKQKISPICLKLNDITTAQIRFLGLMLLMGQVKQ